MKNLLTLFLLLPAMGFAQQTTIKGSEHPELIPDEAAATAVFSVHSMFDTPANAANTEKDHAKLNLSVADHAIYDAAMQSFASSNSGRRNALNGLRNALSPDGLAKLNAFIQAEKAHMQYKTGIGGPQ